LPRAKEKVKFWNRPEGSRARILEDKDEEGKSEGRGR